MAHTLQIKLKELQVKENGDIVKSVPASLALWLFYARPGYPHILAARDLGSLVNGAKFDFTGLNPDTGLPFAWNEVVAFKEDVVGQVYLAANVTAGPGKLAKFLGGLIKGALGVATKTLANPFVSAAGDAAITAIFGSDDADDSQSIATGGVLIDPGALVSALRIPLKAPAKVVRQGPVGFEPGAAQPTVTNIVVLEKGDDNGYIELVVEEI